MRPGAPSSTISKVHIPLRHQVIDYLPEGIIADRLSGTNRDEVGVHQKRDRLAVSDRHFAHTRGAAPDFVAGRTAAKVRAGRSCRASLPFGHGKSK